MKLLKTHLRTAPLVLAHRALQGLYSVEFLAAEAKVDNFVCHNGPIKDLTFDFEISGFGHGIATALINDETIHGVHIKQYTADKPDIAYSEYYESRHGNRELLTLMRPLLESKLLPVLAVAL